MIDEQYILRDENGDLLDIQSDGGENLNEQIGLVNANIQNNINLNLVNSGTIASGVSAAAVPVSTATTATTATGFAAAIPAIGVGVAVISAAIGIAQIVQSVDKKNNLEDFLTAVRGEKEIIQEQAAANDLEYGIIINSIQRQIESVEKYKRQSQLLTFSSLALIGLTTIIIISKYRKK
jgi:hypothetical protein